MLQEVRLARSSGSKAWSLGVLGPHPAQSLHFSGPWFACMWSEWLD